MVKGRAKASKMNPAKKLAAFKKKIHLAQTKHKKAAAKLRALVASSRKKVRAAKAAAKKAHATYKKLSHHGKAKTGAKRRKRK